MLEIDLSKVYENLRRKRIGVFSAALVILIFAAVVFNIWASQVVLRISNWETGEVYIEEPVQPGDTFFFGWMHSLEKIPWNEYYHITSEGDLVLDTISFPAFGAGIPENKGREVRIENGLIYMGDIGQVFHELAWLNSHYAVRDIKINDRLITRGEQLPEHTRLTLKLERRFSYGR